MDPKSESVWATWVSMEEAQGFLERADDLRIRQAEQQWEFEVDLHRERAGGHMAMRFLFPHAWGLSPPPNCLLAPLQVPANFTTRPRDSPLAVLADTLARFFTAREKGRSDTGSQTK